MAASPVRVTWTFSPTNTNTPGSITFSVRGRKVCVIFEPQGRDVACIFAHTDIVIANPVEDRNNLQFSDLDFELKQRLIKTLDVRELRVDEGADGYQMMVCEPHEDYVQQTVKAAVVSWKFLARNRSNLHVIFGVQGGEFFAAIQQTRPLVMQVAGLDNVMIPTASEERNFTVADLDDLMKYELMSLLSSRKLSVLSFCDQSGGLPMVLVYR